MTNPTDSTKPILSYRLDTYLDDIEFRQLRDTWILPELLIRKLARHYLLYWDKKYLIDMQGLKDGKVFEHQGCKYISILNDPLTAFQICNRVALSFRHPVGTKFGYVLIKAAIKRNGVESEH